MPAYSLSSEARPVRRRHLKIAYREALLPRYLHNKRVHMVKRGEAQCRAL